MHIKISTSQMKFNAHEKEFNQKLETCFQLDMYRIETLFNIISTRHSDEY